MKPDVWERVSSYLGAAISPAQQGVLGQYRDWLESEALPAGGIGPDEIGRLEDRHIADSLLFFSGWDQAQAPITIWDLGSGVGLPGIPLAVLLPDTELVLVDRSERRVDLARRAVRVLDLGNVTIWHQDMERLRGSAPMMVSRASTGLDVLASLANRHLQSPGVVMVGGSWVRRPRPAPDWTVKEIPPDLLDRPVWLLMMRR